MSLILSLTYSFTNIFRSLAIYETYHYVDSQIE